MAIGNTPSPKFSSIEMYGGASDDGDVEPGNDEGDRGEGQLEPDEDEVSEDSEESTDEDAPPDEDTAGAEVNPDDLAVALEAARQEVFAAQQRAAQYEEQLAHIASRLQRPTWDVPFDALDDESLAHWEGIAARRGSDPRTEYRLHQEREEQREAYEAATLGEGIRNYFTSHADYAELGGAVLKMLESDPVNLTPFLPPQHALRDAAWRIDSMFSRAKLLRLVEAKKAEASAASNARAAEQRNAMKAATRGEASRRSGVNLGTADSQSSRRTPADDIKAGVMKAAKASRSLLA